MKMKKIAATAAMTGLAALTLTGCLGGDDREKDYVDVPEESAVTTEMDDSVDEDPSGVPGTSVDGSDAGDEAYESNDVDTDGENTDGVVVDEDEVDQFEVDEELGNDIDSLHDNIENNAD